MIVEKWLRCSGKMLFSYLKKLRIININWLSRVFNDIVRILRTYMQCKRVYGEPNYNLTTQITCQLFLQVVNITLPVKCSITKWYYC